MAVAEGLYASEAFLQLVLDRLVAAGELEEGSLAHHRGKGLRGRNIAVDAYDLASDDDTVLLVVLDYDLAPDAGVRPWSRVTKHLQELAAFADEAVRGGTVMELEPSSPAYGLAASIHRREVPITRFVLYYVTDGMIANRTKEFVLPDIGRAQVTWHVQDMMAIYKQDRAGSEREAIEIDLVRHLGHGLPCLPVKTPGELNTYLAAVPGDLLADLYREHGSRLLESNVRAYLSGRGKINKGIRTTLQNDPVKFLPYNNGITATAASVSLTASKDGPLLDSITDLQIVNGGQTTASLFYSRRDYKADLANVWVQMKLVEVEPSDSEELVPAIARYANSQNKVNETDFFSNHPFHQRLEQLGNRQVFAPSVAGTRYQSHWFYERTRGAWENQRNKEKQLSKIKAFEAEYPKAQIITKTDAAKYLVAWEGRPHVVSQGAQKNFMAFAEHASKLWTHSQESVNQDYYRNLVAKGILFRDIRLGVLKSEWYDKGYLANITAYTLAALPLFFEKQFRGRFDLDIVWREQTAGEQLTDELVRLAKQVWLVLTDERRPIMNVTEWAKREECWKRVQALDFRFVPTLKKYAISREVQFARAQEASANQKADNALLDEMALLTKPKEFWPALNQFGRRNRLLDERALNILNLLMAGKQPSPAQIGVIHRLVTRATKMGFEFEEDD